MEKNSAFVIEHKILTYQDVGLNLLISKLHEFLTIGKNGHLYMEINDKPFMEAIRLCFYF